MKPYLLILVLLSFTALHAASSKIGVIHDKDGYTNLRTLPNKKSNVVTKIYNDTRFNYFEDSESEWWVVELDGVIGYMHKSRISFESTGYIFSYDNNFTYTAQEVSLNITSQTLKSIEIRVFQFNAHEDYNLSCRAYVQTIRNNKVITQKYYAAIEPVGSYYGIIPTAKQTIKEHYILHKLGDYQHELLVINTAGIIHHLSGNGYFLIDDTNYLVVQQDGNGITVFDISSDTIVYSNIIEFTITNWYKQNGTYYYTIAEDLDVFKLTTTDTGIQCSATKDNILKSEEIPLLFAPPCNCD